MLWIPDCRAELGLAALGPRVAGNSASLLFCLLFLPLGALVPRSLAGRGRAGWDVGPAAAIGVFSQSEAMAAACTLLTAAVYKTTLHDRRSIITRK